METLRIFISSPGDVAEERDKAKQVIAALQCEVGDEVTLLPVLWEDLAIPATASFQRGIDFVLSDKHRIDIAVFILWSRLGTPLGAAITKPDGGTYRSGTEREFDLMLAAFEQSGGKIPVILAYAREDSDGFHQRLEARAHDEDDLEELIRQRKLVKQFIQERFHDAEGRSLRAYHTYHEPVSFAQRLHVHLRQAVDRFANLDRPVTIWNGIPYRSLEVFDIQHAPIFCGRDEETCKLLLRLRQQRAGGSAFVCIVGASGSGKSSLARAGVAATLIQRSFDEGVKEWRAAILIPGHAQGALFPSLAECLARLLPELREGVGGLARLAHFFESQNHEAAEILLASAFKTISDNLGGPVRLLVVLDQMEELWTDRAVTPELREQFLRTVEALARTRHISVLATLRSDFYPQAQLSEAFLRMKGEHGHFDLTPPGAAALRLMIVQPALRAGLHFERDAKTGRSLDQMILDDAVANPASLPLLEYALSELYERRAVQPRYQPPSASSVLRFADYQDIGGLEGAIGRRAEAVFDALPLDAKAALDELAPLLVTVTVSDKIQALRHRTPLSSLVITPALKQLTDKLVEARFLTTDQVSGTPIVALAHEALIRQWKHLADWIEANARHLRMRSGVEHSQARWSVMHRDTSLLLPAGLPLEEGSRLLQEAPRLLTANAREYVEESVQHHTAAERRAARIRRNVIVALSALSLAAVITGLWAWRKQADEAVARGAAEASATRTKKALDALLRERAAAFDSAMKWLIDDGFYATPARDGVELTEGHGAEFEVPVTRGFEYAFLAKPVGDSTDFEFTFSVEIEETGKEVASAGSSLSRWFHLKADFNGAVNVVMQSTKGSGEVVVVMFRRGLPVR